MTLTMELHFPSVRLPLAAEALLTDRTRYRGLTGASSFKFTAVRQQLSVAKRQIAGEEMLKSVNCAGCYELGLQPLPEGTSRLRAENDISTSEAG